MFVNSHFTELLQKLNSHTVKYLVVGGYAAMHYGEPRYTKDLDLWVSVDPENARRVDRALVEFGMPLAGYKEQDFEDEGHFFMMGNPPMRIDIMLGIPGVAFAEAWENRLVYDSDGLEISYISREDLIIAKRAAGRPQDLIDADHLENLK
jgi:hypothetical protein